MTEAISSPAPSFRPSRARSLGSIGALAGWVLLLAVFANTWWYARTTANPLVSSDAWHFVETFVPHALDGTAGIAELYAKRDGFDHAQPLNKLFLMLNARYWGLDFMYEALAGVLAGIAGVFLLKRSIGLERPKPAGAVDWLLLAAIAAVYLSLNSSMVFTWSLVAFGYVTTLVVLMTIHVAWRAWRSQAYATFALAMGLCAALTDDSGVLLSVALAMTFVWAGWRERRLREALVFAALGLLMVALYVVTYAAFDTTPRGASPAIGEQLSRIVAELRGPEGWRILTPLASGLAFYAQLEVWFGSGWERAQLVLGLVMLACHALFWWHALRRAPGATTFMAIALMLLFYGFVAGIVYGRVPSAGLGYLNEPRYVALYGLQIVAMLLLVATRRPGPGPRDRMQEGATATLAVALLALQLALSVNSWNERKYVLKYWRSMATQTLRLGSDPWRTPQGCVAILVVCDWQPGRRKMTIDLLQRYQLNVFSPRFRERHGFEN